MGKVWKKSECRFYFRGMTLNTCLQRFCVSETNKWRTVQVSLLKAIRAAIDRYLNQAPIIIIVGDYEFKKANDTLNTVCKNLM